jgi:uncharacterized protein (DUF952 family)
VILHIAHRRDWEAALSRGHYSAASLETEGFIHCSTPEQVVETANRFFPGQQDLVLLTIDESKLEAELRYEPASGGSADDARGELFPHLCGRLNLSAVVRVVAFAPGADGRFTLPAG